MNRKKDLIEYAESLGWYIVRKTNHIVLRHPKGGQIVMPSSGGGYRSELVVRGKLRRWQGNTPDHEQKKAS